jgi:hypothetical protein
MGAVAEDQNRLAERVELKEPIKATLVDVDAQIIELSLLNCRVQHFGRVTMGSTATLQFQWRGEKIKLKGKVARTTMKPIGGKPAYESAIQFGTTLDEAPDALKKIMKGLAQPFAASEPEEAAPEPQQPKAPSRQKAPAPPQKPAPPQQKPAPVQKPAPKPAPVRTPTPPPMPPVAPPPMFSLDEPVPFLREDEDEIEEIEASAEIRPVSYVECTLTSGKWTKRRVNDPKQPREGFTMIDPEDDADLDEFCKTYQVADPETRRMIRVSFEVAIAQRERG